MHRRSFNVLCPFDDYCVTRTDCSHLLLILAASLCLQVKTTEIVVDVPVAGSDLQLRLLTAMIA